MIVHENPQSDSNGRSHLSKKTWIMSAVVAFALVCLVVLSVFLLRKKPQKVLPKGNGFLIKTITEIKNSMDEETYEECSSEAKRKVDELACFPSPVPSPFDANLLVTGLIANECRIIPMFGAKPLVVCFKLSSGVPGCSFASTYKALFKVGDDLRQDQFVNKFAERAKRILGGKMKCYNVVALSSDTGFVEFI